MIFFNVTLFPCVSDNPEVVSAQISIFPTSDIENKEKERHCEVTGNILSGELTLSQWGYILRGKRDILRGRDGRWVIILGEWRHNN